jgi:transposase-like protein
LTDAYLSNANLRGADFERTILVRASLFDADLAVLSISNTVSILELFGVDRVKSTVHNWVHKAELQPEDGHSPDHVAVDETVIRLNDEQYWLYAAVDTETNELLHTKLEPTRTNVLARALHRTARETRRRRRPENYVAVLVGTQDVHVLRTPCFSPTARRR